MNYNYTQQDIEYGNKCAQKFWDGRYDLKPLIAELKSDGNAEISDKPFFDYAISCTRTSPYRHPSPMWSMAMQIMIVNFLLLHIEDNLNNRHFSGRLENHWNAECHIINFWLN